MQGDPLTEEYYNRLKKSLSKQLAGYGVQVVEEPLQPISQLPLTGAGEHAMVMMIRKSFVVLDDIEANQKRSRDASKEVHSEILLYQGPQEKTIWVASLKAAVKGIFNDISNAANGSADEIIRRMRKDKLINRN
jgi:hypothetical protein